MIRSVRNAAALLLRHQRLIWWIFLVNLVLAFFSSLPARLLLASTLDHTLEGLRFVDGFDITALALLMGRPVFPATSLAIASLAAVFVYFVYLVFLDGGIFAEYLDDRKLSRGEFFENCGLYLWRMIRIVLYSLLPFVLVLVVNNAIGSAADKLGDRAAADQVGFYISLAGSVVSLLLFLFVRMWFDLVQAQIVSANERRVLRTVFRSFPLALRNGGLYLSYLGIAIFSFLVSAVLATIWFRLPHRATLLSLLALELITLLFIASRLWMKAASARRVALLAFALPEQAPVDMVIPAVPAPFDAAPESTEPLPAPVAPVAPEATDAEPPQPSPDEGPKPME